MPVLMEGGGGSSSSRPRSSSRARVVSRGGRRGRRLSSSTKDQRRAAQSSRVVTRNGYKYSARTPQPSAPTPGVLPTPSAGASAPRPGVLPTPAPNPYTSGGGYVGGGAGGAGGAGAPAAPPVDTGEGAAGTGTEDATQIATLDPTEIEAALAAIEARYGLTREQLMADQTELGAAFRMLMSDLARSRDTAFQGAQNEAIGRGVLRSGIYQKNAAELSSQFARQGAYQEQENARKLAAINAALAALDPQRANERVQTAVQIADRQVGTAEARAEALRLAQER